MMLPARTPLMDQEELPVLEALITIRNRLTALKKVSRLEAPLTGPPLTAGHHQVHPRPRCHVDLQFGRQAG